MSYHPDYGWVMQQNTGPTPQSYVFEAQAAAYSHYSAKTVPGAIA